jgi:hypothetical protein
MQLKTRTTDGGKSTSGIRDTNDCTIRALAISAGIPYEDAHRMGVESGRKQGRGHSPHRLLRQAKKYGITYRKTRYKRVTIQRFIKENMSGHYYVATNRHAFAIVNGIICDSHPSLNRPLQRLEEVYLMLNPKLTSAAEVYKNRHSF